MKKYILIESIIVIIIVAGYFAYQKYGITPDLPVEENTLIANPQPDQNEDIFSISSFLAVKDKYENKSVNIKGIVKYKYECPECPKDAFCKPCANDYIILDDELVDSPSKTEIFVNFFKDEEVYKNLQLEKEIVINVTYNSENLGGAGSINGYFVYNALGAKSDMSCDIENPDPDGYLLKICKYLRENSSTINIAPADPEKYNIRSIKEGEYVSYKNGKETSMEAIVVSLDCCYMGDIAYFDKNTKEIIGFHAGDL